MNCFVSYCSLKDQESVEANQFEETPFEFGLEDFASQQCNIK